MARRIVLHIAICLIFICSGSIYGQSKDTVRVLFVGNSYTYFWNLSQTVEALSQLNGIPLIARNSTAGGASLKDHWMGRKMLRSREIIQNNEWDIVVLQNHSRSTIDSLADFYEYGDLFIELVKSTGATPILYETWARAYNPLMQKQITTAYDQLALKHKIEKVPVGTLWQKARILKPDLPLFDPDGSHPSPLGTYLTACTFYCWLNDQEPAGLPERVTKRDQNGEILYLNIQGINQARFIHDVISDYLTETVNDD